MKKAIRGIIGNFLQTNLRISEKNIPSDVMEKKLFIESILLLKEIDDRRDFMESELGVDMSVYEEKFLQVVENLFKIHYNKEQLALIQFYLYQVPLIENYDGKIDLEDGKAVITVQFETPEDVYIIVSSLKKPEVKFGRKK
jgi:hypothetical protein